MSFHNYYHNGMLIPIQHGSGMDDMRFYRTNVYRMRGNGLGGFFASIARKVIPFATKYILPSFMSMGKNVLDDVTEGGNFRESLKTRGIQALKDTGRSVLNQSGSGLRGRKRKITNSTTKSSKKAKTSKGKKQSKKVTKVKKAKKPKRRNTSSARGQRINCLFD